jgi:hypothetical protein
MRWLYDQGFESTHGWQPGTLKALARDKQAKKLEETLCYSNRLTLRGGLGCSALALPNRSLRTLGVSRGRQQGAGLMVFGFWLAAVLCGFLAIIRIIKWVGRSYGVPDLA